MASELLRRWLPIIFFALCLVLGGSSGRGSGSVANAVLQSISVIVIVLLFWRRKATLVPAQGRTLAWLVGLFTVLVLVSLIPLPPSLWPLLPRRAPIASAYDLLGIARPALPISLDWENSISSILWLLPPTAMFLLAGGAPPRERRRLVWTLLIIAVVSMGLGAMQLLGGPESPLRPYEVTNRTAPVGLFANTNHLALLLVCNLTISGYVAARAVGKESKSARNSGMTVAVAIAVFLIVGIGVIGSLAGYGLAVPAGFASFLVYRRAAVGSIGYKWLIGIAAVFALFIALASAGSLNKQALSNRIDHKTVPRGEIAQTTFNAITQYMPFGAGLGTFQEVYRTFEDPYTVDPETTNHAHNDYLEFTLEMGLPGVLLILGFFVWWTRRTIQVWTSDFSGGSLARIGSVIVALVLLHSLVDFPIRNSATASLFALACALLIPFVPLPQKSDKLAEKARHLQV